MLFISCHSDDNEFLNNEEMSQYKLESRSMKEKPKLEIVKVVVFLENNKNFIQYLKNQNAMMQGIIKEKPDKMKLKAMVEEYKKTKSNNNNEKLKKEIEKTFSKNSLQKLSKALEGNTKYLKQAKKEINPFLEKHKISNSDFNEGFTLASARIMSQMMINQIK